MKYSILLVIGVSLLVVSAAAFSVSFTYPYVDGYIDINNLQPLPNTEPSSQPSIAFTTSSSLSKVSSYAARTIIFDVNGSYYLHDNASITIHDNTGKTVYDYPIKSEISYGYNGTGNFPIRVVLEKEGSYVGRIENVELGENTFLMAYSQPIQLSTVTDFAQNVNYALFTFAIAYFSVGWVTTIKPIKPPKEKGLKFEKNDEFVIWKNSRVTVLFSAIGLSIISSLVLLTAPFDIIIKISLIGAVLALIITYSLFSIRKLQNIHTVSYERICIIERNAVMCAAVSVIIIVFSLLLMITQNYSDLFFTLAMTLYFIAVLIALIPFPFYSILNKCGRVILPLRKFIKDYNDDQRADFTLIAESSKRIRDYYESIGIMISQNTLTTGMFNEIVTKKSTIKIEEFCNVFMSNKNEDFEKTHSLLTEFLAQGNELEKMKIRARPSVFERYSRQLTYIATILAIITTVIAILQFLLSIG